MKKYYVFGMFLLSLAIVLPNKASAIVSPNGDQEEDNQITNASDLRPASPETIRERLRADYQERVENIKANQNYRNGILEERGTTTNVRATIQKQVETRLASSTRLEKRGPYERNGQAMRIEIFNKRKAAIMHELEVAIRNLNNVKDRIEDRIEKAESSGRDMTKAKQALIIANTKITLAQNAVKEIASLKATSTPDQASGTASTTMTIDLQKPNQIAETAKKAIREAKNALNDVIVAIAKSMGLKIGNDNKIIVATTTTPVATTTTPVATSTNATSTSTTTP